MASFSLQDLEKRVQERARASAEVSYTRKLLAAELAIDAEVAPTAEAAAPHTAAGVH